MRSLSHASVMISKLGEAGVYTSEKGVVVSPSRLARAGCDAIHRLLGGLQDCRGGRGVYLREGSGGVLLQAGEGVLPRRRRLQLLPRRRGCQRGRGRLNR